MHCVSPRLARASRSQPDQTIILPFSPEYESPFAGFFHALRANPWHRLLAGMSLCDEIRRDPSAATVYDGLFAQSLRVGTMDLRLAAIALSRQLTVLTRNFADFGRVPGLTVEDRTV